MKLVMQIVLVILGFTLATVGCSNNSSSSDRASLDTTTQAPKLLSPSPATELGSNNKSQSSSSKPRNSASSSGPSPELVSKQQSSNKQRQSSSSNPPAPASSPSHSSELDSNKPNQIPSSDQTGGIPDIPQRLVETKSGESVPIGGGAYVNATGGLVVRNFPGGKPIGKKENGQRVSLTGAEQFANGRTWVQLASGGWVAKDYISYK